MVRRLFKVAVLLSLALCVGTAVLWVWSYLRPETFLWEHCDTVLAHRTGEYWDDPEIQRTVPDGPTADRTIELMLDRGSVRLRRERFLEPTREAALNAEGRPATIAAPGWHLIAQFVGGSLGMERPVLLIFPDWATETNSGLDVNDEPLPFELRTGPERLILGRYQSAVQFVTTISFRFWMLFALTLVFPIAWVLRRSLVSRRSRRLDGRSGPSRDPPVRPRLIAAPALSLVICLAVASLWVRSYRAASQLECYYQWTKGDRLLDASLFVTFSRGELRVRVDRGSGPTQDGDLMPDGVRWTSSLRPVASTDQWHRTGFGWHTDYFASIAPISGLPDDAREWTLLIPLWLVVLILSALPAYCAARIVRWRRRAARNLCVRCGYDLRGTPGRCPECGDVAAGTKR